MPHTLYKPVSLDLPTVLGLMSVWDTLKGIFIFIFYYLSSSRNFSAVWVNAIAWPWGSLYPTSGTRKLLWGWGTWKSTVLPAAVQPWGGRDLSHTGDTYTVAGLHGALTQGLKWIHGASKGLTSLPEGNPPLALDFSQQKASSGYTKVILSWK